MPHLLIFGASRGLGRGLAEEHLRRGWQVTATVRGASSLDGLRKEYPDALRVEVLDTTDWSGVDALRAGLAGTSVDLLFVNAGISGPMVPIGEVDPGQFDNLMHVNVLAPLRIVDRFADLVPAAGTAAVMSSQLGSIADNSSGGFDSYRISKTALNMGLKSIAARRAGEGRTYLAVHPGWVQTDMGGPSAPLRVEDSVRGIADMLERRRGAGGTAFVSYENRELPW